MTNSPGWHLVVEQFSTYPVAGPTMSAIACQLVAAAREWLRHRTIGTLLRSAPTGSRITLVRRGPGGMSGFAIIVGDVPRRSVTGAVVSIAKETHAE
ncbi:hypothetical protein [Nocardia sp. alder85J]|uniref:hypothetical protein n=1 Tax=Nocardia sp. alder85J TaxID=2862949 RepID=UPI001CD648BD|nr:hypothetical protein [Nocardia sp. alder85J]MCX4093832.1 hypothetical protein [Nocardia sp. alder85J]